MYIQDETNYWYFDKTAERDIHFFGSLNFTHLVSGHLVNQAKQRKNQFPKNSLFAQEGVRYRVCISDWEFWSHCDHINTRDPVNHFDYLIFENF